ncbi:YegS/Rv2252/BmrU family lipid kinase [Candidatus Bipolaricaulota bacterium]|nr:YegS/Rv2252/BmrU family lipid kinase [Candidatus Bipolaricaulota bacterium]MCK5586727.1 YegS/Rv2252/BmrU family lipid kinase [Candidatus Bipolaricaulota bacterium]
MGKYRLIVNPTAGGGTAGKSIPDIERRLHKSGLDFDLVQTERPWHAVELARAAAAEVDVVVAVGGDGTANEVLNGLMLAKNAGHTVTMGVLCVGRGNDFAFGVGIPTELAASCEALTADRRRTIDVGHVVGGDLPEGRYFGNGVGIGFDAVVGFVAAKMKHVRGFVGYFVAAIKTIFVYFKAPLVRLEFDGQPMDLHALMVSVMNGTRMGGGFMMAPNGVPDDGVFDLCIARQVSRPRIFAVMLKFMKGTQAEHPAITTGRTNRITVTAMEGTLPAHADGETLCTEGRKLELEIIPNAIEIVSAAPGE